MGTCAAERHPREATAPLLAFPPLLCMRVIYRVINGGRLPPLPTTSFHGALAKALWHEVCLAPARNACRACPAQPDCPYARLFEPAPPMRDDTPLGVTDESPRPLALAPEPPLVPTGREPIDVGRGDEISFRVVVAGPPDGMHRALVRALRRAGRNGIGRGRAAVRLELHEAAVETRDFTDPAHESAQLELLTPLRLKAGGRIRSEIYARDLVDGLIRRVALLATAAGSNWHFPTDAATLAAGLRLQAEVEVLPVNRHSARQGTGMTWPGLVGTVHIAGPALGTLWPLLRFGEAVQIGKATTFGFGRYRLVTAG